MGNTLEHINQSHPSRPEDGIVFAIVESNKKSFD